MRNLSITSDYVFKELYVGVEPRKRMSFAGYVDNLLEGRAYTIVSKSELLFILWNDKNASEIIVETLTEQQILMLSERPERLIWIMNSYQPQVVGCSTTNPLDVRQPTVHVDLVADIKASSSATTTGCYIHVILECVCICDDVYVSRCCSSTRSKCLST